MSTNEIKPPQKISGRRLLWKLLTSEFCVIVKEIEKLSSKSNHTNIHIVASLLYLQGNILDTKSEKKSLGYNKSGSVYVTYMS